MESVSLWTRPPGPAPDVQPQKKSPFSDLDHLDDERVRDTSSCRRRQLDKPPVVAQRQARQHRPGTATLKS